MVSKLNQSNHTIQLWFARVGDVTLALEHQIQSQLFASEYQRFKATKSPDRQREFLLSRALMRHAIQQLPINTLISELHFLERPNNLPQIIGLPENYFYSLSHSNGIICFALAKAPIGIDLEKKSPRHFSELADLFMTADEREHLADLKNTPEQYFYAIWCAKEAYYKAQSQQKQKAIIFTEISINKLIKEQPERFYHRQSNELCLAIYSPQQISINLEYRSLLNSFDPRHLQELMTHQH